MPFLELRGGGSLGIDFETEVGDEVAKRTRTCPDWTVFPNNLRTWTISFSHCLVIHVRDLIQGSAPISPATQKERCTNKTLSVEPELHRERREHKTKSK